MLRLCAAAAAGLFFVCGASAGLTPVLPTDADATGGGPRAGYVVNTSIANVISYDPFGDPGNTVMLVNLATALGLPGGSPVTLTGVGWDIHLTTYGTSWLSDASINFDDPTLLNSAAFDLVPGLGSNFGGTNVWFQSVGIVNLNGAGLSSVVLPTGVLRLEFYESFDDLPNAADAIYHSTLSLEVVPEPASGGLLAALCGAGAALRRRR